VIDDQFAFIQDVAKLIIKAVELGYVVTGGELYRTLEQQQYYVDHGLSHTMNSNHLRRLAIDLNVFKDGNVIVPAELGVYWETLHPLNRWGGHFTMLKDTDHFERNIP
jgi:hypothetical protein